MAGTNNGYRPRNIIGGLVVLLFSATLGGYALFGNPTGRIADNRVGVTLVGAVGIVVGLWVIVRSIQSMRR